ncbi:MAG: DUF3667 domain-containing protein [Longimicrobiales bacterium]
MDELFFVDGKMPRTFRALARPGLLTAEWLAGRRHQYVRPFRLYLAAAAIWAVVGALEGAQSSGTLPSDIYYVYLIVLAIPAMTFASWLAFTPRRSRGSAVPFVVLSLHFHSAMLTVLAGMMILRVALYHTLGIPGALLETAALAVSMGYLPLAARRAFALSWRETAIGGLLVYPIFILAAGVPVWLGVVVWIELLQ